jgi:hypothetical protein
MANSKPNEPSKGQPSSDKDGARTQRDRKPQENTDEGEQGADVVYVDRGGRLDRPEE